MIFWQLVVLWLTGVVFCFIGIYPGARRKIRLEYEHKSDFMRAEARFFLIMFILIWPVSLPMWSLYNVIKFLFFVGYTKWQM